MHPVARREPEYRDEIFHDLARMLTENRDRPTWGRDLLKSVILDFSPVSLQHLDDYVYALHRAALPADELTRASMRLGAYLGEVIRYHCTDVEYHWIGYDDAAARSPAVRAVGMSARVMAVLWTPLDNLMCFPIAKAAKCLECPQDEGLYAYARLAMARLRVEAILNLEPESDLRSGRR